MSDTLLEQHAAFGQDPRHVSCPPEAVQALSKSLASLFPKSESRLIRGKVKSEEIRPIRPLPRARKKSVGMKEATGKIRLKNSNKDDKNKTTVKRKDVNSKRWYVANKKPNERVNRQHRHGFKPICAKGKPAELIHVKCQDESGDHGDTDPLSLQFLPRVPFRVTSSLKEFKFTCKSSVPSETSSADCSSTHLPSKKKDGRDMRRKEEQKACT